MGLELVAFAQPVFNVSIFAGGASGATYSLKALIGEGQIFINVTATPGSGKWEEMRIDAANITAIVLNVVGDYGVFDDLSWNLAAVDNVPEPGSMVLMGLGLAVLAGWRRRLLR